MNDLRMNERAWTMAEQCIARADELRIAVHTLSSGSVVIDAGIGVTGGLGAGIALAELCMGGLGHVTLTSLVNHPLFPAVPVTCGTTDGGVVSVTVNCTLKLPTLLGVNVNSGPVALSCG